jgi:hypothetical protein
MVHIGSESTSVEFQIQPDGREAIRALSWEAVDSIVDRFSALNPYDREIVPGSILKIEDVNFTPETGEQRPIHCFAISAKRYAFFTIDSEGRPEVIEGGYWHQPCAAVARAFLGALLCQPPLRYRA